MSELLRVAAGNLLQPMVLFFALGFAAALLRSDLRVPEAIGKGLALYLMLAIGFKGGVQLSLQGLTASLLGAAAAGIALSFLLPLLAFALLRWTTRLQATDAAAVAAHYGSISVVTFIAAGEFLDALGVPFEGHMVAVMALMETPAIVAGLWLARRGGEAGPTGSGLSKRLMREIFLNGSVVLLIGAFVVGWITGADGMDAIAPFIEAPFKGVLCLFLLDMGLLAALRLRKGSPELTAQVVAFGLYMPPISAGLALLAAWMLGLSPGDGALLATLAGSASYIAVPAAMRLALPKANAAIYLTLSLAVTFPFNLAIGIPLYGWAAGAIL